MKKLFLSLFAVLMGAMSSIAQDDLVATLSHGSSISTYIGADALSEAYTAAAAGDIITLSPGVFNAVDIEKAVTVRGAGMMDMETNGFVSTQLAGDMTINVPSSTTTLTIEGVQTLGTVSINGTNLEPIKISKCRFESSVRTSGISMSAYACIFASGLNARNDNTKNTTLNCLNCVIVDATSAGTNASFLAKIVATNCLVELSRYNVPYSVFTNCIITSDVDYYSPLPETCSAQNCIGINVRANPDLFANIVNPSNVMVEGVGEAAFSTIFKTLKKLGSGPAITETYELTETAATTYLGDDGTQVGIYGGATPYNPTPSNPQVKKFTVSSTTEGEQLKVKINVE